MMPWEDVTVQLIDTPPITADYMDSHLHGLIRAADLALLLIDLASDNGDRTVPGRARSACRRRRPGWRPNPRSTSRMWACRTRGRSWCRTRSTPPARPSGSICCTSCFPLDFPEYVISAAARHRLGGVAGGDLPVARRGPHLLEAPLGQGARPRSSLHRSPRQHAAGDGRPGAQGFSCGPEVRPRLGYAPSTTAPRSRAIMFCTIKTWWNCIM